MEEINIQAHKHQLEEGYYKDPSEPFKTATESDSPLNAVTVPLRGNNDNHYGEMAYATPPLKKASTNTDNPKVFVGHFDELIETVKERLYDELKQDTDIEIETKPSEENFETGPDPRLMERINKMSVKEFIENAPAEPEYKPDHEPDKANLPVDKNMSKRRFQNQNEPKYGSKEVLQVIVNEMKANESTGIKEIKSGNAMSYTVNLDNKESSELIAIPILEIRRSRNSRKRHDKRQRHHENKKSSPHNHKSHKHRSHNTDNSKSRHREHHKHKETRYREKARHEHNGRNKDVLRDGDRDVDRHLRHHNRESRNKKRKGHKNEKKRDATYVGEETDFDSGEKRSKIYDRKRKERSYNIEKHSRGESKQISSSFNRNKKQKESMEYNFNDKTLYADDIFSSDESSSKKPVHKVHNTGDAVSEQISWGSSLERRKNEPKKTTARFTRPVFSISTPDYFKNQPNFAAKYDFNEPIPVKDQEDPRPKKLIANIPSSINGKKDLYVEGHLING